MRGAGKRETKHGRAPTAGSMAHGASGAKDPRGAPSYTLFLANDVTCDGGGRSARDGVEDGRVRDGSVEEGDMWDDAVGTSPCAFLSHASVTAPLANLSPSFCHALSLRICLVCRERAIVFLGCMAFVAHQPKWFLTSPHTLTPTHACMHARTHIHTDSCGALEVLTRD